MTTEQYVVMDKWGNLYVATPLYPNSTATFTVNGAFYIRAPTYDQPAGLLIENHKKSQVYGMEIEKHIEVLGRL